MSYHHFLFVSDENIHSSIEVHKVFEQFLMQKDIVTAPHPKAGGTVLTLNGVELADIDVSSRGEENFDGDLDLMQHKASQLLLNPNEAIDELESCDVEICFDPTNQTDSSVLTEFVLYLASLHASALVGWDSGNSIFGRDGRALETKSFLHSLRRLFGTRGGKRDGG